MQQNINPNVISRDGSVKGYDASKINHAITMAYLEVEGEASISSASTRDKVEKFTAAVTAAVSRNGAASVGIEDIQDQVELALMRSGEHAVARSYVLFRERKAKQRAEKKALEEKYKAKPTIHVVDGDVTVDFDHAWLDTLVRKACEGLTNVSSDKIVQEVERTLYDGVKKSEVEKAILMAVRTLFEKDPAYEYVAARLLLAQIEIETGGTNLKVALQRGVDAEIVNAELLKYDLERLQSALKVERDLQFRYLGLQTLYDRYFVHVEEKRIEMPQVFFMRVAMGLALNENDRNERAIEFYNVLSTFDFMSSTPTLFNSGTRHSQMSSCYLSTVSDDLGGIYDALKDNALLSKFAGGLGNDWTPVRAMGARIKGTNGQSQGVVPFLKVVNDTAVAVNQGGKRKGAVCAYLETWHLDVEEFLDLRKNTGDDRRRTHDMNTANWIPDLFMKRVMEGKDWTLFSPNDVPDLHDLFGLAFESAYVSHEQKADAGEIKLFKRIPAVNLWRKMLTMIFETGHPWITFKDPCNIRSPQQHIGVVHSSNLCTEITLNTSADEIAVCNLGSINLANHVTPSGLDLDKLRVTVRTTMRMLDNVIDINYYAVDKARDSNLRHRPVGMGIMGFQDALYITETPYSSDEAVKLAGLIMESVAFEAYTASSDLADERGVYSTYEGSLWSKGILPQDSMKLLADARQGYLEQVSGTIETRDWAGLRAKIAKQGMRNSNCLAIAPTATISNIVGVDQSIEPKYQNLYVKSNLSGEFTVINHYLVDQLKKRDLWDETMIADLKYFDGSLQKIGRIPAVLQKLFATAFEVEPKWLIDAAAARQYWIDQAQSLNIYMAQPSGKKLDETYKLAWIRGLKTTYYLRSLGATSAEKSTSQAGSLNAVQSGGSVVVPEPEVMGKVCTLRPGDAGFEECESCQ